MLCAKVNVHEPRIKVPVNLERVGQSLDVSRIVGSKVKFREF